MKKILPALFTLLGILATEVSFSQNDSLRFTYNGYDALKSDYNFHHNHFGGFRLGVATYDEYSFIVLPTIYYEYAYLIFERNNTANISVNAQADIAILDWFLIRLPVSANFVLGSMASTQLPQGLGFSIGGGYEYINSTFRFQEEAAFLNIQLLIDNVRVGYQQSLGKGLLIRSTVSAGIKFDF